MSSKKSSGKSSAKNATNSSTSREIISDFVMGEEEEAEQQEKDVPKILAPAQTKVVSESGTTDFAFHLQTAEQLQPAYMNKVRHMS